MWQVIIQDCHVGGPNSEISEKDIGKKMTSGRDVSTWVLMKWMKDFQKNGEMFKQIQHLIKKMKPFSMKQKKSLKKNLEKLSVRFDKCYVFLKWNQYSCGLKILKAWQHKADKKTKIFFFFLKCYRVILGLELIIFQ